MIWCWELDRRSRGHRPPGGSVSRIGTAQHRPRAPASCSRRCAGSHGPSRRFRSRHAPPAEDGEFAQHGVEADLMTEVRAQRILERKPLAALRAGEITQDSLSVRGWGSIQRGDVDRDVHRADLGIGIEDSAQRCDIVQKRWVRSMPHPAADARTRTIGPRAAGSRPASSERARSAWRARLPAGRASAVSPRRPSGR